MNRFSLTCWLGLLAFSLIAACEPKQDMATTRSDAAAHAAAPEPSAPDRADEAPPPKPREDRKTTAAREEAPPPREKPAPRTRPGPPPPDPAPVGPNPASTESVAYQATTDAKVLRMHLTETDPSTGFAGNAFPPTVSDTEWHRNAWWVNDCLRCHETGVATAPAVKHEGLIELMLASKCRSCHVLIPGQEPKEPAPPPAQTEDGFAPNAFPPMIPYSESHLAAWTMKDCMLCHETGVHGAPLVQHKDLPALYLRVKCRTCHVQVRSHEMDPFRP